MKNHIYLYFITELKTVGDLPKIANFF